MTVAARPRRARVIGAAAVTLGALAVVSLAAWLLARTEPAGWTDPQHTAQDPAAAERARALEQNLAAAITRVRTSGEPWAVRIHAADINAWIATRLPLWQGYDPAFAWPLEGVAAQVQFTPGAATLLMRTDGWTYGCRVAARVAGGRVRIEPGSGSVGRLPIPLGGMIAWRLLQGNAAADQGIPAVHALHDGRSIEVRAVDFVDGAVEVEFATSGAAADRQPH